MIHVNVTPEIASVCPQFVGAVVEAHGQNSEFCAPLWQEINALAAQYRSTLTTETLKQLPAIEATRRIYRACGKDPSRYRPASEALIRRLLQDKPLYQINTFVDLINIAGLPVYRDAKGGVGTPTSDNERTKIDLSTTHVCILVNGYDGNVESVTATAQFLIELLTRYADAKDSTFTFYR